MNSTSFFGGSIQLLAVLAAEVGLVFLAAAVAAWRARSASWRRVFWQAGLIASLTVTVCELSGAGRVLAGWVMDNLGWPGGESITSPQQAQAPVPQLSAEFRAKLEARLAARRLTEPQRAPSTEQPRRATASPAVRRDRSTRGAQPAHNAASTEEFSFDSLGVLALWLVWAAGMAVVVGRAWIGRCLLLLFRRRRRRVTDPLLLARVQTLSHALGMRRPVGLVESDRLHSPIAFGLARPTIGLPRDFSLRFTPARQEAMLAHELAHLAARDPSWSLLADFCAALLWWHPAVWWARREFHLASEQAADEASLVLKDGPAVLAECLLELGARLAGARALGEMDVSGFRSHLGQRIQRLLHLEAGAWSPPPRLRAALLLALGPLAMAALVVLCTAWATPRALTKGNDMQSMPLTLKRSLSTLALLLAVTDPDPVAAAAQPGQPSAGSSPPAAPGAMMGNPAARVPGDAIETTPATDRQLPAMSLSEMEKFRRRYGLMPTQGGMMAGPGMVPAQSPKRQNIENKLNEITLPEIKFDGLPLSEVIAMLSDQATKLDPEKKGINFLINANNPPSAGLTSIDPATGLASAVPVESIDVGAILVKFSLPLRNVALKDTLEAIVRVAERPLEYSVEDYGVVVSLKAEAALGQPLLPRPAGVPEPLVACTYKVDTNTFLAGLENAFGISVPRAAGSQSSAPAREIQTALRTLLTQLGVSPVDAKTVFYNDLTGMLMVRATEAEQGVIQAAIETLGGTLGGSYGGSGGGGGFGTAMPGGRYGR